MRRSKYPTMIDENGYLTLTDAGHDIWMKENNPDGWDDATWHAFAERCATSESFKAEAQRCKRYGLPRPHPLADGWVPAAKFNPLRDLTRRMRA